MKISKITITKNKKGKEIWERVIPVKKAGRDFDLKFWQSAGSQARFSAAWQMLKEYELIKGRKPNESKFRLRRTVQNICKAQG